jgi:hypothetical protein
MNKVAQWLNVNKLSLNIKKTKFILFRSSNKKPNNKNIEQAKSTTFLGIIIAECLN